MRSLLSPIQETDVNTQRTAVAVLLEDQRSKASCKRNINATLLLIELDFWAFQLSLAIC